MSRVFVIGDTHFGHSKIIDFCRPQFDTVEEMNQAIVDNWNSVVKKDDTVIHLGDVAFANWSNVDYIGQCNGYKRLVLGNHDAYPMEVYLRNFDRVYGLYEYKGYILSHIPVHRTQVETRFKGNIHGHLHELTIGDPKYFCASVEQIGLTPMPIDDIIAQMRGVED